MAHINFVELRGNHSLNKNIGVKFIYCILKMLIDRENLLGRKASEWYFFYFQCSTETTQLISTKPGKSFSIGILNNVCKLFLSICEQAEPKWLKIEHKSKIYNLSRILKLMIQKYDEQNAQNEKISFLSAPNIPANCSRSYYL